MLFCRYTGHTNRRSPGPSRPTRLPCSRSDRRTRRPCSTGPCSPCCPHTRYRCRTRGSYHRNRWQSRLGSAHRLCKSAPCNASLCRRTTRSRSLDSPCTYSFRRSGRTCWSRRNPRPIRSNPVCRFRRLRSEPNHRRRYPSRPPGLLPPEAPAVAEYSAEKRVQIGQAAGREIKRERARNEQFEAGRRRHRVCESSRRNESRACHHARSRRSSSLADLRSFVRERFLEPGQSCACM